MMSRRSGRPFPESIEQGGRLIPVGTSSSGTACPDAYLHADPHAAVPVRRHGSPRSCFVAVVAWPARLAFARVPTAVSWFAAQRSAGVVPTPAPPTHEQSGWCGGCAILRRRRASNAGGPDGSGKKPERG
jgi:hypothetical protein